MPFEIIFVRVARYISEIWAAYSFTVQLVLADLMVVGVFTSLDRMPKWFIQNTAIQKSISGPECRWNAISFDRMLMIQKANTSASETIAFQDEYDRCLYLAANI